jgi:hypothetical protein
MKDLSITNFTKKQQQSQFENKLNNEIEYKSIFNYNTDKQLKTIEFNTEFIDPNATETKKDFYMIRAIELNNIDEYTNTLKNYLQEKSKMNKQRMKQNSLSTVANKRKRLIFIHDSFMSYKSKINIIYYI